MHAPAEIPNTLCNVVHGIRLHIVINTKPKTARPSLIFCALKFFIQVGMSVELCLLVKWEFSEECTRCVSSHLDS